MALGEMSDLRPHLVSESHYAKTFLEVRRSDFGVISLYSLLLNDQASWVKKIQRDLKVRTKP